ncbi:MAG: dTDP-4-dehydrorhamnose reductase [Candidatus Omnitrophota bacterium]
MEEYSKKRILITGVKGMLGPDLAEELAKDYHVFGLDLDVSEPSNNYFLCDITKKEDLENIFTKVNPWLVIHSAAYTNVDLAEDYPELVNLVNVQGTKYVAEFCNQFKAKLVYISTDYVFDGEKEGGYDEYDLPNPINVYGHSKLGGEKVVSSLLSEYLIVRTSWLFGYHGKNFVTTIIDKAKHATQLKVVNDQRGSPTYTKSLAQAINKLITAVFSISKMGERYGIFHISNTGNCSWFEFAQEILKLNNINIKVIPVTTLDFPRAAQRPKSSVLNNRHYQRITHDEICSWQKALQNYFSDFSNFPNF